MLFTPRKNYELSYFYPMFCHENRVHNFCPNVIAKVNLNIFKNKLNINLLSHSKRSFYSSSLRSHERIGPMNREVQDVLVGSLLGDGFAEKRGPSTRILLKQSAQKINYIKHLHKILSRNGICSLETPKCYRRVGKNSRISYDSKFSTYSFCHFNHLHEAFYGLLEGKHHKKVPNNISDLVTERVLAHWIMDDGSLYNFQSKQGGLKISTESFSFDHVVMLQNMCKQNFGLITTIHKHRMLDKTQKPVIYFPKQEVLKLSPMVRPYFEESMLYKIM